MKKASILMITVVLLVLASCGGPFISTTSMLIVIEKGCSSDYKEYWVKAYDPNNQTKEEAFKIVVQEKMVWNLIEEDKEYFSFYTKEGDKSWVLEQIEHIENQKD
ncbi:hypothetical protein B857_00608 [Solibacillus isronensis B3W22]|uniref:Lipoprotein n=1 Tax=Solibacillus isronensis B3W22 TaxID=1224748 RepID=K1L765_9BACL|nr:hypothetical protein [Solibacillus isronensis]AMO85748.1 hypothetical protein SOLI23_09150 [Solibacillus silvestris]EKB46398.1 hypothetical protein B857_00608 [Solibacillus isronensis B3W22]